MKNTRAIALGGILVAIHVIILAFSLFLPGAELFLMLFAPLFSAMYTIKNKTRNILIFSFSTLLLCFLLSPQNTLLFILPILLTGISYGLLTKAKLDNLMMVYVMAIVESILFILSMGIIQFIYDIDIIVALMQLFNIIDNPSLALAMLLIYSLSEAVLLHYLLKHELIKFDITFSKYEQPTLALIIVSFILLLSSILLPYTSSFYLVISLLFGLSIIPLIIYFIRRKRKYLLFIFGASILLLFIPLYYLFSDTKPLLAIYSIFAYPYIGGIYLYFKNHCIFKNKQKQV